MHRDGRNGDDGAGGDRAGSDRAERDASAPPAARRVGEADRRPPQRRGRAIDRRRRRTGALRTRQHAGHTERSVARGGSPERRERARQLRDVLEPARRVLLEAAVHHAVEARWNRRAVQHRRRVHADPQGEIGEALGGERLASGGQLEQDRAERPDVAARVGGSARAQLLGRHVAGRAHHCVGARQREVGTGRCLGDPEVDDLDQRNAVGAPGDEQVGRLEVAVDDLRGVGLGEPEACLHHIVRGDRRRERAVRGEHAREVTALEQLHHEVRRIVEHADVGHAADMLAAQLRRRSGFAQKALDDRVVVGDLGQQELERDALAEMDVRRSNDDPHAAAADHAVDLELPRDEVPGRKHGVSLPEHRAALAAKSRGAA